MRIITKLKRLYIRLAYTTALRISEHKQGIDRLQFLLKLFKPLPFKGVSVYAITNPISVAAPNITELLADLTLINMAIKTNNNVMVHVRDLSIHEVPVRRFFCNSNDQVIHYHEILDQCVKELKEILAYCTAVTEETQYNQTVLKRVLPLYSQTLTSLLVLYIQKH